MKPTAVSMERVVSPKKTITSNYSLKNTDKLIVCDSVTDFTISLLAATGSEDDQFVKNINTGKVTLKTNGTDTIEGVSSIILYKDESIKITDYLSGKIIIT